MFEKYITFICELNIREFQILFYLSALSKSSKNFPAKRKVRDLLKVFLD